MPHVMPELPTLAAPSSWTPSTPRCFPHFPDAIPPGVLDAGRYRLRFAWTRADLHAVQRLRFAVFNEELGEGPGRIRDDRSGRRRARSVVSSPADRGSHHRVAW
jgi:putative hemolysin